MSSMHYPVLLITLILNLLKVNTQWVVDDDKCQTPNGGVGICINISACQPIIDLLTTSPKPLSQDIKDLLVSYRCGSDVGTVKVCCPIAPAATTKRPNNLPDVTNHRNINLLKKSCGKLQTNDKFSRGNETILFEFPWMVLISYKTGNVVEFLCEGTLINDRYVLTAAHCITNLRSGLVLAGVRLGEFDISKDLDCETDPLGAICSEPVQDISIEEAIPHAQYNFTSFSNDIGLLRLAKKANISTESVNPICLPITSEVSQSSKAIVTGWGRTANGSKSNILLNAKIPIIPQNQCQKSYENIATITSNQICAGGENQPCVGVGGGPILFIGDMDYEPRYIQYGVDSFGPTRCGLKGLPGVYTKITAYLEWILDNLKP